MARTVALNICVTFLSVAVFVPDLDDTKRLLAAYLSGYFLATYVRESIGTE